MQYTCDPSRMCPLKSHRTPGPASDQNWATLQASEAWKWSKRFGTSYLSLSFFLHKGWGFNLSSNKRCGTSLLQGFLTLNLGNPHSTMVVWLWILSVSNYCTRISPSCDVMIHPWKYGLSETCHIQDCRPSTAHIEGHNQQWLLPNQWTTSGRNWIWKTSDLITRADTGQPGNGEQWQRVSNTLISTASSQCITISSQKDHNVIMCHCSYFFPLNIQGNIHTTLYSIHALLLNCLSPPQNSLFYIYLRGPSPSAWMILSKKPAFTGILGGKWLRLFDIYTAAKYYINK